MVSHRGHPWSLPASHSSLEEEKSQSQSPASNIKQPDPAHPARLTVGHAIESGRPASPT